MVKSELFVLYSERIMRWCEMLTKESIINMFEDIDNIEVENQNIEYGGMKFTCANLEYRIRISKQTPKKSGQFVALWEKGSDGKNTAYTYDDFPDFLYVFCQNDTQFGYFKFSCDILSAKGILKTASQKGKMGFRVYPSWDTVGSKQALQTQAWQSVFFTVATF